MCGIAGIFNLDGEPVPTKILKKMTDVLAHRGPDGEGQYIDSFFGTGHRRLAILDLTPAGHQPMVSANKQFILSYNGQIYNFQELRAELERLGHQFHSKTDSEVVLNSWVEWGESCVHRFNGMFAFSIWDKRTRTLFLVRDRYGIKPLYYANWGDTFLYEMKCTNGNIFSKFGQINSRYIISNHDAVQVGTKLKFQATIKQHKEFNNEKYNVISTLSKF